MVCTIAGLPCSSRRPHHAVEGLRGDHQRWRCRRPRRSRAGDEEPGPALAVPGLDRGFGLLASYVSAVPGKVDSSERQGGSSSAATSKKIVGPRFAFVVGDDTCTVTDCTPTGATSTRPGPDADSVQSRDADAERTRRLGHVHDLELILRSRSGHPRPPVRARSGRAGRRPAAVRAQPGPTRSSADAAEDGAVDQRARPEHMRRGSPWSPSSASSRSRSSNGSGRAGGSSCP